MGKKNRKEDTETSLARGAIPLELFSPDTPLDEHEQVSLLQFQIAGEEFAIGVEHTDGVVDCPVVSPLPSPPDGIVGVASVRGHMIIILDLSLSAGHKAARRRLILLKGEAQLGLLADRVEGVVVLPPEKIHPVSRASQNNRGAGAGFGWPVRALFKSEKRQIPIIDVERLGEM